MPTGSVLFNPTGHAPQILSPGEYPSGWDHSLGEGIFYLAYRPTGTGDYTPVGTGSGIRNIEDTVDGLLISWEIAANAPLGAYTIVLAIGGAFGTVFSEKEVHLGNFGIIGGSFPDDDGEVRDPDNNVVIPPPTADTTPPNPPGNPIVTEGEQYQGDSNCVGQSVTISWTPSDSLDVAKYRIYRKEGIVATSPPWEGAVLVAEVDESVNQYTDTDVSYSTYYSYYISAVDASDNESEYSEGIVATPCQSEEPEEPEEGGGLPGPSPWNRDCFPIASFTRVCTSDQNWISKRGKQGRWKRVCR